jgi:quercetin dioxygenase-like cupin family protein
MLRTLIAALAVAGLCFAQAPAAAATPVVKIIRIFSGADGETHAEEVPLPMGALRNGASFSPNAPAQSILFMSRPGPVVEDWHSAPREQYAITMSGRAEMEIGGGKRIPLPPGSVVLIADTTGKGHRVHVLSNEPWVAAFVPLAPAAK